MEQYIKTLWDLLERAQKKGAQADCILDRGHLLSLKSENAELSEHKVSSSLILGLRVIKDNKVGVSYSESMDPKVLNEVLDEALNFSKYAKEEPLEVIEVKNEKPLDGTIERVYQKDTSTMGEKIDFCLSLESEVKKKDRFVKSTPYNNFSEVEAERIYMNHLGTVCSQKTRSYSCYTSALIEKEGQQSMHYHGTVSRTLKELDLSAVVEESYFHAQNLLGAKPLATGQYDVIFTPESLSSLFQCFSSLFSAKGAMNQSNPWRERVGDLLAHPEFTLIDDPLSEEAFSYSPFDDEGAKTRSCTLIEKGVLKTFCHNSVTSKYFNVPNTYHGARSPKGALGVSLTNTVILPGRASKEELLSGKYFEVVSMQGLHSGADPVSGQFSFGASGYLKEGETLIQPASGITISGNFFQLIKEIGAIGSQQYANSEKDFLSPLIRFQNLTIAGD